MKGISCWRGVFKHKRLPQRTRLSGGKNSGKVPQAYVTWFHHSWISSFFFLFFSFFFFGGGGGFGSWKKPTFTVRNEICLLPFERELNKLCRRKFCTKIGSYRQIGSKTEFIKLSKSPHGQGYYAVFSFYNEGIVRISYNYFHYYFPCTRGS